MKWRALLLVGLLLFAAPLAAQSSDDDVHLRTYVEALIAQERELRQQQQASAQTAIAKNEATMTLRLEAQNGVLLYLKEQQSLYATKEKTESIEKRISALESQRDTVSGGVMALWGGAGFILALIVVWTGISRGKSVGAK